MDKLPDTLYKYTSADAALKILSTSQIRFSSPETFNDPFEVTPPVQIIRCSQGSKEILDQINCTENHIKNIFNSVGKDILSALKFFCLSRTKDSILMWSHYADMHKGVVIEFNTSNDIIKNAEKVIYKIGTIDIDSILENAKQLKSSKTTRNIRQQKKALYYHKHKDWRYEEEYRCSYPFSETELLNAIQTKEQEKYVYIQIPEDSIKAIYLGCKISEINRLAILNLMKLKYPAAKCYKAQKSKDSYKLKFIEI